MRKYSRFRGAVAAAAITAELAEFDGSFDPYAADVFVSGVRLAADKTRAEIRISVWEGYGSHDATVTITRAAGGLWVPASGEWFAAEVATRANSRSIFRLIDGPDYSDPIDVVTVVDYIMKSSA